MSTSVHAQELVIPDNFNVIRVNNQAISGSLFMRDTKVSLQPGKNVIVLRYAQMFDGDLEDHHTTVRSEPFVISFEVNQNTPLRFVHQQPLDINEARLYAKSPQLTLFDANGEQITLLIQSQSEHERTLQQRTVDRRQKIIQQSIEQQPLSEATTTVNALPMLKYWWQRATFTEREAFLTYLEQQER
ncbi:DUF2057 family protein [Thalassotalea ponticola]|uniref:DUF2057 family protein n=1 Tax=Thalassotalea ponticola TaxID=1523392 RepID=UPI0025B33748|nr:DUF2057 family protein [Thalassotalea ponticola]MDN3652738.1 DUF2057 family protein [Thalassotalea ponticola]